ncbi:MAG: polyketide cyclase/dehydrase [Bacteroidetes bacterium]|nr:MAG: polyketide cyclase/dehydrase [Bacteroidota bacterium]
MKNINKQAPVICTQSITINASSKSVWEVLTGIDRWPGWQTDIDKAKLNGPLQSGTSFHWKTGGARIHSTLHTVEPDNQLGWTGKTFGLFAIHNWRLTELEGKTRVEVEESMEGLLAKLFKKPFNKNLEKGMKKWLELLKQESEQGAN